MAEGGGESRGVAAAGGYFGSEGAPEVVQGEAADASGLADSRKAFLRVLQVTLGDTGGGEHPPKGQR